MADTANAGAGAGAGAGADEGVEAVASPWQAVKEALVKKINAERAEAGVAPVELDPALCGAADAHATEMADFQFISHKGLDGFMPYQRYFFGAGCQHHVTESVGGVDEDGMAVDESTANTKATAVHEAFMAGQAPNDVQRRNTLHQAHTHVGIGIGLTNNAFRLVEVFADAYVQVLTTTPEGEAVPPLEFTSDETQILVKALRPDVDVIACTVYYEAAPHSVAREQAARWTSYDDFTDDKAAVVWPWEMTRLSDKSLRIPIFLSPLRAGHYYVQVHVRGDVGTIPYSAPSEDLDIASPDVIIATGLVLTCSQEQASSFEAAQAEAEHAAAEDLGEGDVASTTVEPFSEITIIRSSDPTPAGFRRQQLHELGSFGGGVGGGDVGVHLCMSLNPALAHISHVTVCTAPDAASPPQAPAGYEALAVNIAALITGDPDAQPVFLAVKRVGASGDDAPPLLDVALTAFASSELPGGYDAGEAGVKLGPDGSAPVLLCQTVDGEAAVSAMAAAAEAVRARMAGDGGQDGGGMMEWEEGDDALEFDDPAAEEARRAEERARVYQMIQEARAERQVLMSDNAALQRQLAAVFAARQPDDAESKEDKSGGSEPQALRDEKRKRYAETLASVVRARDDLAATQSHYDAIAMDLQARLDEKEAKASEIQDSFIDFKREIAKAAENSRTGKPIPRRIIKQFEATEAAKDTEVEKVRLKNIHLRTHLRKLEARLKEKEQLADGLHLIDFEQLKIENQTLNEKIEERHEELHKLRKKTTTTVQVLTHIKEKLQFVQARAGVLKMDLANLEEQVTRQRDSLNRAKRRRDDLRSSNDKLRQQQGFVNSDTLVLDFERRKNQMQVLRDEADELRRQYAFLTAQRGGGGTAMM